MLQLQSLHLTIEKSYDCLKIKLVSFYHYKLCIKVMHVYNLSLCHFWLLKKEYFYLQVVSKHDLESTFQKGSFKFFYTRQN